MINWNQFFLGMVFFLAGALEYLFDRGMASYFYFLNKQYVHYSLSEINLFGDLRGWVGDFFHPLAFSLLCMAFLKSRASSLFCCIFWFLFNCLFEFFQLFERTLISIFSNDSILNFVIRLISAGTFDTYDLICFALGSALAYAIGFLTENNFSK